MTKQRAKVGDRIRIVKPEWSFGDYAVGTEMTVGEIWRDLGVRVEPYSSDLSAVRVIAHAEYEIINEEATQVSVHTTVLADESIGGVLREYKEVKRKAAVGEWIKIVNAGWAGHTPVYKNGDVVFVAKVDSDDDRYIDRKFSDGSDAFVQNEEYVTLEPTDIVRVDGERFRMVQRKAKVGERVLIVSQSGPESSGGYYYRIGNVGDVIGMGTRENIKANFAGSTYVHGDGRWAVSPEDYNVIVPVESSVKQVPADGLSVQVEGLTEIVAKLALRVTELERNASDKPHKTSAPAVLATLSTPVKPESTRDQIVARAKADVTKLTAGLYDGDDYVTYGIPGHHSVDFVVNHDKRTVVARLRLRYVPSRVTSRATAKCAPDDCFNVHIGKAIALRRALKLSIPEEYVKAPQPTEPRVGDTVRGNHTGNLATVKRRDKTHILGDYMYGPFIHFSVIDDSRTEDDSAKEREAA